MNSHVGASINTKSLLKKKKKSSQNYRHACAMRFHLTAVIVQMWSKRKIFLHCIPTSFPLIKKNKNLLTIYCFRENQRKHLPDTLKLSCQTRLINAPLRRQETYKCKCRNAAEIICIWRLNRTV